MATPMPIHNGFVLPHQGPAAVKPLEYKACQVPFFPPENFTSVVKFDNNGHHNYHLLVMEDKKMRVFTKIRKSPKNMCPVGSEIIEHVNSKCLSQAIFDMCGQIHNHALVSDAVPLPAAYIVLNHALTPLGPPNNNIWNAQPEGDPAPLSRRGCRRLATPMSDVDPAETTSGKRGWFALENGEIYRARTEARQKMHAYGFKHLKATGDYDEATEWALQVQAEKNEVAPPMPQDDAGAFIL
ncbi:hypothetical protein DFH07DRAFT_777929 [Mycena maculata]|uniref:Uncharacterized protein n=1 Tax=Mycena maculata TaxID=230809 RepID=A0AAD7IHW5_9AGAR|nr:hypothetical protein DFH07DRAFT_777929 [Mycena maculata]